MRTLSPAETEAVSGGNLSIYESTHLKSSAEIAALFSNVGYTGIDSTPGVKCSETTNVNITTTHTSSTPTLICSGTSSFPYFTCTGNATGNTSSTTTTVSRTISCATE